MADIKKYLDYEGLKTYHKKATSEYDGKYALKGEASDVDLSNYPTNDGVDKKISDAIANDVDGVFAKKDETVDLDTLKQVVAESKHISAKIVEALPEADSAVGNVIYLVKKDGNKNNAYDEYLFIDGEFELIGDTSTDVDLGDYFTKKEVQAAIDKAMASVDIASISNDDIDLLFKPLPEGFVPYPANGLYPSPDNFLRVWAGEELIAEIESPTEIEVMQFFEKGVTRVELPSSVTSIGRSAFKNNELTTATIPDSVTSLGEDVFYGNRLTSITIPDSITSIGENVFFMNRLTSVTIPDSITSIGDSAFKNNRLTSVTIPDSVTSIGYSAFRGNPIETVSISRKTTIGSVAFPEVAEIIYRD